MQASAVESVGRAAGSSIAVGDWQGAAIKTLLGWLPTEILCEIFRSTLPWKRRHNNNTHLLTPPWVLGLVCRGWRECALGDVKLWTKIEIDCTGLMTETKIVEHFPLAALETQIARSGTAPLDVKFESSRTPWASDYISCLLELLVQQSNRWERLDLTFLHIYPLVLTQIKGNLQSLKLTFCSAPLPPQIHDVFEIAPQLRDVTMINDSEDTDRWDAPVLSASWEQITRYGGSFSAEICVDILCRAELLVECGLHDSGDDMSPGTSLAILPRLRRLAIAHPRVLKFLKTPNLEYLFGNCQHPGSDSEVEI
ncbi:hypothetical protein B0H16DRAFT_1789188 [Mycena metata]|uniref:F-box domain-containing protein n=1 Tax=Mycena metata TaxID=1033252 RepID=A0AAD7JMG5_9AGAR|nr:hypothetical protein B0H16DRAFT_1789188 [Mycena metata]